MGEYLFVYGTLRSEFSNPYALRLRAEARLIGPATVRGSIFRVAEYPGFRSEPEGAVQGELYLLDNPANTLATLDRYEGAEYQRVLVTASTGVSAWIYAWVAEPAPHTRISSGDFLNP